ncbi:MAG: DNA repair protein RecO C-terminal domain-containing protein, partial [Alphaproteobacteria bacterium]|nr:DNA repair protein RecO C-terminal domain-containing protein [Alphaproteobacteria bacterium]
AHLMMSDTAALLNMNNAFNLINAMLPERAEDKELFDATIDFASDSDYLKWQIAFLSSLGYAIDLRSCGGCGTRSDLKFISKKTGRAVCGKCAEPYMDQVFSLPLTTEITDYFINKAQSE